MKANDPINPLHEFSEINGQRLERAKMPGLDLRTHIAIEAMKALIVNADNTILISEIPSIASSSVMVSDALIAKLNNYDGV